MVKPSVVKGKSTCRFYARLRMYGKKQKKRGFLVEIDEIYCKRIEIA
jgi:hypothetical protein